MNITSIAFRKFYVVARLIKQGMRVVHLFPSIPFCCTSSPTRNAATPFLPPLPPFLGLFYCASHQTRNAGSSSLPPCFLSEVLLHVAIFAGMWVLIIPSVRLRENVHLNHDRKAKSYSQEGIGDINIFTNPTLSSSTIKQSHSHSISRPSF